MNTNRRNIVNFYLKDMIAECGLKSNPKKGETNDQFKVILHNLKSDGLIKSSSNFLEVKANDKISCILEIDLGTQFFMLYDHEKVRILDQTLNRVDNMKLLLYYCYLKCRMYKRSGMDDLRAEICYPTYEKITTDLGITDETITKYNKILIALDLIRIDSAGLWYYKDDPNKSLKESSNIYTLFETETKAKLDLNQGIKYWMRLDTNYNKIFTGNREYKNNNRQLNGELGAIIKKEKNGTATEKDIARKSEILSSTKPNEGRYKIKALLSTNEGELLSNIYDDLGKDQIAREIVKLEQSLGLADDEGKLLVEYSYYKWVIENYEHDKHEYYVNCVNKKIKDKEKQIVNIFEPVHKPTDNGLGKSNPFTPYPIEMQINPFKSSEELGTNETSEKQQPKSVRPEEKVNVIIRKVKAIS